MKAVEIEIGGTYLAKVSGKVVPVVVQETDTGRKGWGCRNTTTGREIWVKSAQRFRERVSRR